nr:YbfB/YjiJ family MFS transporter [Ktedonosporobacter rubrisoli]
MHNRILFNTLALLLMNITMFISALSMDVWQLGLWRFLVGFFSAIATVLTMSLTLECIKVEKRGTASGIIWMGGALGVLISGLIAPSIVNFGAASGWRLIWIAMSGVGVLCALGFHSVRKGGKLNSSTAQQLAEKQVTKQPSLWVALLPLFLPRRMLFLTLAYCGFGCGYIIYFTYFIALITQQGVPATGSGFVWAAIGLAGALSSWLWGGIVDRWPTGFSLAVPLGLGTLGALTVLVNSQWLEYSGAAVVGLAAFIAPALIVTALLKRAVNDEQYALCFSILTSLFAIGQLIGPVLGGAVIEHFNLAVGTAASAALLGLAALCACGYGLVARWAKIRG